MSYSLGAETVDADARMSVSGMKDFSRIKMRLKDAMIKNLGDVVVGGQRYPKMSYNEGLALIVYWRKMGEETAMVILKDGPWGPAGNGLKHYAALDVVKRFNIKAAAWMGRWLVPDPTNPTALNPVAIQSMWSDVLSRYVIELDNSTWAAFNIETPSARALLAAKESVESAARAVSKKFIEALETASTLWTLTKFALYGSVFILAGWGITQVMKRGQS